MSRLLPCSARAVALQVSRASAAVCMAFMFGCGEVTSPVTDAGKSTEAGAATAAMPEASAITSGAMYSFDLDQLIDLQSKALLGDGDAASELSEHYSLRKQWPEADSWDQIGAENGNPISAEKLARAHWSLGGFHNCQRAIFWINQAKSAYGSTPDDVKVRDLEVTLKQIEQDEAKCLWAEIRKK